MGNSSTAVLQCVKEAARPSGLPGETSEAPRRRLVAKMKAMETDDPLFGKGMIRIDGRKVHDMFLYEVKRPEEFEGSLGLLQAARHNSCGGGLPPS